MTLDHVVDPVQLARFLELSGCSAPTGRVSSSATLSSFSVPATTVVRAIDLATAEAPLAFAAVLGEQPTRVVIVTAEALPDDAMDAAEPLQGALSSALAEALGESATALQSTVTALDHQLLAIVWTPGPGVRVAAVLDNPGFTLLARPGVHAAAQAAMAAFAARPGVSVGGVVVILGLASAVWGIVTASVPLLGAGSAALLGALGMVSRESNVRR